MNVVRGGVYPSPPARARIAEYFATLLPSLSCIICSLTIGSLERAFFVLKSLSLLLLLSLPVSAQQKEKKLDFPVKLWSDHYFLKSTATETQSQELLDFMEIVHKTYMALLKPKNKKAVESREFTLILHKDNKEYMDAGAPKGSGAYYNGKELVGYYDPSNMKPFFAHEGMHQFTDITSKNMDNFPMWFTEGIADCIGNSEVRKGKLYMCVKSGDIARMRLPLIQKAIKDRKAYSLRNLLRLNRRKFMSNAGLCYAQSWSFCHFLMTYPKQEDRGKQIPNGKYRKKLATYYELMRDGGISHDEAWKIAFKGLTLYELEARWKKYVQELDAGKFLGVQCAEIEVEEAKKLGLEDGCSGIRINSVNPGSAAASGDLQKEDILIDFDGKKFQQGESLLNLRQWMQKVPYSRSIKVIVLRDGKEIEARLKWKRP